MNADKLAQFAGQEYLNFESYRKNGQAITTPMWFAEADGQLLVYTLANAAKVGRVRNNPRVRVAPCDVRGGLKGDWVEATAIILDEAGAARGHALLRKKYGWKKRIGDVFSRWLRRSRVVMTIRPD
jgi:PPOX class probable F420-dependent enzyme